MNTRKKIGSMLLTFVVAAAVASAINGCAATETRPSTGQYLDDSAITAKVKALLVKDPVVSGLRISVETYQGVVQLSGFANSRAERNQAEEIAKHTEGVRSVKNDIHLK